MKKCDCGLKIKGRKHEDGSTHYLCLDCAYYEVEKAVEKKAEKVVAIRRIA